ncbi:hypothetical protein BJV82DRAFT_701214 [Fennellomyces sp. T-0311]|nr:hypothetical protein BJV82DRAFT_701214 [Fennellomyces sp. T-0311]
MTALPSNSPRGHQSLLLQSGYSIPSVFSVFPKDDTTDYDGNAHQEDQGGKLFDGLVDIPDVSEPGFLKFKDDKQTPSDLTISSEDEPYASTAPSSLLPTQSWNPMPLMDNNHISHVILPYCCCGGNHWHGNDGNYHENRPVPCTPHPWAFGSYGDSIQHPFSCGKHTESKSSQGNHNCFLNSEKGLIAGPTKDRKSSKSSRKSRSTNKDHERESKRASSPPSPMAPVTQMRCQTIPGYQKSRRTKTSYDPKTSYRLNTLFFESFGNGRKPTKEERRRIQRKTGITSRRLTYWLSNHKRRFGPEISAYKRLAEEGQIASYDDFVQYCNKHYVPEIQAREDSDSSFNEETEGEGTDVEADSESEAD